MDFNNMTKEQLINILTAHYAQLIKEIPNRPDFKLGFYYLIEQTGNNQVNFFGTHSLCVTFEEANKYFSCK